VRNLPQDFIYDTEHPVLTIPFKVQIDEHRLEGAGLSVAAASFRIGGALAPTWVGRKQIIKLVFDFPGFTVSLFPEAVVTGSRHEGEMTLQFMDPAGAHLPQLRYIMNSYIAGDVASMNGMLSYTGPLHPKAAKSADKGPRKLRIRGAAAGFFSLCLIIATSSVLVQRLTQSHELRPVFVERMGQEMKATTAGQISYLNPEAKAGEVVFSVNSNTGDILSFKMPCNCEVAVTDGVFVGATVLPIDPILSLFDSSVGIRVQTQMSIEGLGKAMNGERAYLDLSDGRSVAIRVVVTSATTAASQRGEPFVPVTLQPAAGSLTAADIGKTARLRLSRPWIPGPLARALE